MRILIVGDPTGRDDEGMKRVNGSLQSMLESWGHSCVIDSGLTGPAKEQPWDKIVFTAGPTKNTLCRIAVLRLFNREAEITVCGLMPQIPPTKNFILSKCVDKIISDSSEMLKLAEANKIPTVKQTAATFSFDKFLRSRERAKPKKMNKKIKILHVGHLNEKRNVYELAARCKELGFEITFLISSTVKEEAKERVRLEKLGAEIISGYQSDLFEFYRKYDIYAFPVKRADAAIAMPLSIIEALLSGLNVISTDFGEISDNFAHSKCVKIVPDIGAVTSEEVEELVQHPIMEMNELMKYDTARFANEIIG